MTIKTTKTYTSDRGEEYELSDMDTTHLLNAINHHEEQRTVVRRILDGGYGALTDTQRGNMNVRLRSLEETISVLIEELINRDPKGDNRRGL